MKVIKANRDQLEALSKASQSNGKLDQQVVDSALDRILKAAQLINDEVSALLAKCAVNPSFLSLKFAA